ncbi:N-acetyltransferase, partial [Streptomyces sp. MZ04]|uniref:GNAT family N-acetyltransferase n=1 Tax=Streptomyces sp. MZ04 TaxID=2559236 RepID=UPI00107EAF36
MKIRTGTPADTARVREVITQAFGSPEDADLVDALRADDCWIPELSLAPVSVTPDHQSTGIGTALIRAALDAARNQGEHTVTVLGHPTYYPRFGFERADAHGVNCTLSAGPDEAKRSGGTAAGAARQPSEVNSPEARPASRSRHAAPPEPVS